LLSLSDVWQVLCFLLIFVGAVLVFVQSAKKKKCW